MNEYHETICDVVVEALGDVDRDCVNVDGAGVVYVSLPIVRITEAIDALEDIKKSGLIVDYRLFRIRRFAQ